MIAIDNVLVSEEIIEEQFVCDLSKCKGGCCEDGDAGAPLEKWELEKLKDYYEVIKPYMTEAGELCEPQSAPRARSPGSGKRWKS